MKSASLGLAHRGAAEALMSRAASWTAVAVCAVCLHAPGAVAAAAPALRVLSPTPAADGTLTYAVGAEVDLLLSFAAEEASELELQLLPFRGEHGDSFTVHPSLVELPDLQARDQRLAFKVDRPILTLQLRAPALPAIGKYTGALAVMRQGKLLQTYPIVLTRSPAPRPAKVTVDPKSVVVYQTGSSDKATFKVQASNASAEWPVQGVYLRLLDLTAPAGTSFDPARHLRLTWNGVADDALWRSPAADGPARAIAPSRQAEIGGELVGVAPGEYTLKVGLGAANATVEGDQQITLKLHVKHGLAGPICVLLLAIVISWFATKGMEAQRRRVAQMKKLAELHQDWLREEPAPLPAIAARAILKQADDRNRSWWKSLLGQDTTGNRIEKAELLLRVLARVRVLQARVRGAAWTMLVRNRARKELNRIVASLDPGAVDAGAVQKLEAELQGLEQWFDAKRFDEQYWSALSKDMENLAHQVRPENFGPQKNLAGKLLTIVKNAIRRPPKGSAALAQAEEAYAKLKVLWEREQEGDTAALATLGAKLDAKPGMSIEEFFREADDIAWSHLETAELEFTAPAVNEVDPPRAYQLIRFSIAPKDRRLGRNYLFKHNLEYVWTLQFRERSLLWWRRPGRDEPLPQLTRSRTNEPSIVQYAPGPGTLHVSVRLRHKEKDPAKIDLDALRIQGSSEYGWLSAFRVNEVIAVGIATVLALLSGLMTYYLNKPAFGTLTDYITLFIWGAGADQAKNFIQNLERTESKG